MNKIVKEIRIEEKLYVYLFFNINSSIEFYKKIFLIFLGKKWLFNFLNFNFIEEVVFMYL